MEQITSQEQSFQLKGGMYTLTTIQIMSNDLAIFELQLQDKIKQAPIFFANAPVIIDFKLINQTKHTVDIGQLKQLLLRFNLIIVAIKNANDQQREVAAAINLAILRDGSAKNLNSVADKVNIAHQQAAASATPTKTKIITEPVRSGQQVLAADGDLIVLNQVGHGAEILAVGNIHIYGALRGRALAGINGNTGARIFCHSLEAELISIAGNYLISEDIETKAWQVPSMVIVKDNKLHVEKMYA